MMDNSIEIKNIGKCYKIYPSRTARLKEWVIPFSKSQHQNKWVLQDINLTVGAGEAVGIIGLNGAGKSTLLKIVTGTTIPTTGSVKFNGSVAALLELGLGFHPDFTGRQNVYMSGQLLGYSNEEITACMQQVEDFAEIGDAIDAPVRTYSSGMQVRLAFSVATMKRPDILIVDEALSVGDAYFQHKSFNRIKEFRDQGTTLLFVSHDKGAIQAVCNRAVLLEHGKINKIGTPEEIMDYYNAVLGGTGQDSIQQIKQADGRVKTISGDGKASVEDVYIVNGKGDKAKIIGVGEKVTLVVKVVAHADLPRLVCGFSIKDSLGQTIYGTNSDSLNKAMENVTAGTKLEYRYTFPMTIGIGNYSLSTALHSKLTHEDNSYEWRDLATVFEVINFSKYFFTGSSWLETTLEVTKTE